MFTVGTPPARQPMRCFPHLTSEKSFSNVCFRCNPLKTKQNKTIQSLLLLFATSKHKTISHAASILLPLVLTCCSPTQQTLAVSCRTSATPLRGGKNLLQEIRTHDRIDYVSQGAPHRCLFIDFMTSVSPYEIRCIQKQMAFSESRVLIVARVFCGLFFWQIRSGQETLTRTTRLTNSSSAKTNTIPGIHNCRPKSKQKMELWGKKASSWALPRDTHLKSVLTFEQEMFTESPCSHWNAPNVPRPLEGSTNLTFTMPLHLVHIPQTKVWSPNHLIEAERPHRRGKVRAGIIPQTDRRLSRQWWMSCLHLSDEYGFGFTWNFIKAPTPCSTPCISIPPPETGGRFRGIWGSKRRKTWINLWRGLVLQVFSDEKGQLTNGPWWFHSMAKSWENWDFQGAQAPKNGKVV